MDYKCPICGNSIQEKANTCNNCGCKFTWPEPTPSRAPVSPIPITTESHQLIHSSQNESSEQNPIWPESAIDTVAKKHKTTPIILVVLLALILVITSVFAIKTHLKKKGASAGNNTKAQTSATTNGDLCFNIEINEFSNRCKTNFDAVMHKSGYETNNYPVNSFLEWSITTENEFQVYTSIIDVYMNKIIVYELNNKIYSIEIQYGGGFQEPYHVNHGYLYYFPAVVMTLADCNYNESVLYDEALRNIVSDETNHYCYFDNVIIGDNTEKQSYVFYCNNSSTIEKLRAQDNTVIVSFKELDLASHKTYTAPNGYSYEYFVPKYDTMFKSAHKYANVYDFADLLTDEGEKNLQTRADQRRAEGYTVYFLTFDDACGKSTITFTDDFYDYYITKLNFDKQVDGILYAIDMDNREVYINTGGALYNAISEDKAYSLLDKTYQYASDKDYYTCLLKTDEVTIRYLNSIMQN